MGNPELVRAKDLDQWAGDLDSHFETSILVRRLILATAAVDEIEFAAREDTYNQGWDGVVQAAIGHPYVPAGASRWEVGVRKKGLQAKAQSDYKKRTADPLGADPAKTTFVFATIQTANWRKGWREERAREHFWADVRAYGASDLEIWLESAPSVHYWISERLGRDPRDVTSPDTWWKKWSRKTRLALSPRFLLGGRDSVVGAVSDGLIAPGTMVSVVAPSRQEALAVTCASLVSASQARGELRARALVVSGASAWDRIIDAGHGLVLVPDFDDPDVAAALDSGHRVIVPAGRDMPRRGAAIQVPDLDHLAAARVLVDESRLSWDVAGRYAAHASRSLLSFQRSIAVADSVRKPAWAEGEQGRRLVPLLLAGEWNNESDGDRAAIEVLTGRAYADVGNDLAIWSVLDDPPLRRAGQSWRIIDKPAVWDLVSPLITAADMARFRQAAVLVLREPDPALDVPPDRLYAASIFGMQRTYSARLRDGLADTAAFLAGYAGEQIFDDGRTGAEHASDLTSAVAEIFNADLSGRAWQSAADVLPLLAEASPDVFLSAVETGTRGEIPALLPMFMDAETASNFGVSSWHIPLVEALQALCWSEDYLGRAAVALARLARIDPDLRQRGGLRPAQVLAGVFRIDGPQTPVPLPGRLAVIDALGHGFPAVAWPLLRDIVPERDQPWLRSHHPRWRDWHRDQGGPVPADQVTAAAGQVTSRMIKAAGTDADRWADLVRALAKLPAGHRDRGLSAVEMLDPHTLGGPGQVTIWRALTEVAARHRRFPGTWWAMPPAVVSRIENAAQRFAPESLDDLYCGLFSDAPELPGVLHGDHGYWEALQSARRNAVRAVMDSGGACGLLDLGRKSQLPSTAGWSAAEVAGDLLADDLLPLLAADGPDGQLASGYAGARIDVVGTRWADDQLQQHPEWPATRQVTFLLAAPRPTMSLFTLIQRLDPAVQAGFWQQMEPLRILEPEARRTAARELTRHGCPWSAIPMLALLATSASGPSEPDDVDLIETVLLRAATGPSTDSTDAAGLYTEVRDLLDYLERSSSGTATRARLELLFTVLLDQFRPARALPTVLRAEPGAFAEIVSTAYLPDHQAREDADITPVRSNLSVIAITALRSWRTPPGTTADGTIDPGYLHDWIDRARHLLTETGHAEVGDQTIGRVLAHAPADTDGIWPPAPIRGLIEELESTNLEKGLLNGKIHADLIIRSPVSAADADHAAAKQFRRWSRQVIAQWRTAALLRQLAAASEERARNHERFSREILH